MLRKKFMNNILDRVNYSVFILEVPNVKGKELHQAVKYKVRMLYPGTLDNCAIVIKKNGKLKESYIVFVLPADAPKKITPLPTLFMQHELRGKSCTGFYVCNNWIEIAKFDNGALKDSIVKRWKSFSTLQEYVENYIDEKSNNVIFCCGYDVNDFKTIFKNRVVAEDALNLVKKTSLSSISIYNEFSAGRKYFRAAIFFALSVFILTAGYGFYKYKITVENRIKQEREEKLAEAKEIENEKIIAARAASLETEYSELIEKKKIKPFDVINIISSCMDRDAHINSLTIKNNSFQLEAIAKDPLKILNLFEGNRQISSINMHQVLPVAGGERFSLDAVVLPVKKYLPVSNSLEEKIKVLEELIKEEKSGKYGEDISDSLFGMEVRDVIKSCGCFIDVYQYLGYANEKEIEFSIRSTSRNFFNFLKAASMPAYNCDFTMVQIRNLSPRDAVNAVVRIKMEADNGVSNNVKTISEADIKIIEIGIDEIGRNYFAKPKVIVMQRQGKKDSVVKTLEIKPENAPWLVYIGTVSDAGEQQYVYVKNTKYETMLKLEIGGKDDMSCAILDSGDIEAVIENKIYRIRRNR
jgi:hypothetical protein